MTVEDFIIKLRRFNKEADFVLDVNGKHCPGVLTSEGVGEAPVADKDAFRVSLRIKEHDCAAMQERRDYFHSLWCAEVRRANAAENALRDILPVFYNESTRELARVYANEIARAESLLKANAQGQP